MNSQYFSEEQAKSGELDSFLKALRSMDYGKGDSYNDVHVKPADCGAYVVEWEQMRWEGEENKGFKFIDYEHAVMLEKEFPDGSSDFFYDEEDYKQRLEEWLEEEEKQGRIWKKNQYGRWYDQTEQDRWEAWLKKEGNQ